MSAAQTERTKYSARPPTVSLREEWTIGSLFGELPQERLTTRISPPTSFLAFLAHVRIESDPEEGGTGGPIPFDVYGYQRERAESWDRGTSEIILKPRQIGFSWLGAAYAYYLAAYHQSSHVALFSAGEREVKKLLSKVGYIHDNLPAAIRPAGMVGMESASFVGGSTITGYPATKKAGIGTTLKLALFDEAAFHTYLRENQGAVVPALGDFGQLIILSTADPSLGAGGWFYDFYQRSVQGKTNCHAVFLPADCRPGRDEAWFANERSKYDGDDDSFRAFYPFSDAEAFVGRAGLVFGRDMFGSLIFDPDLNVQTAKHTWLDAKWRLVGIDPGGSDPNAMLAVAVSQDEGHIHVFGEQLGKGAWAIDRFAEWLTMLNDRGHLNAVVVDPSAKLWPTLSAMGFPAFPANNDKTRGLAQLSTFLRGRRLTIDPVCKQLIHQLQTYWFVDRKDSSQTSNAILTRTPADHHADLVDCLRYVLLAILDGLPSSGGMRREVVTHR